MKGISYTLMAPFTASIICSRIMGLMLGAMMYLNTWKRFAPSSSAASYMSGDTDWIAPMNITRSNPMYRQMDTNTRQMFTSPSVERNFTGSPPKRVIIELSVPSVFVTPSPFWKNLRKIRATATVFIM